MNRVWAEIDFDALKSNVELAARAVGTDISVMAVVKADAYGHGAVEISRNLVDLPPIKMLGVSSVEEGLELRESGITAPVLVMGVMSDCGVVDSVKTGLTPSVFTENCLVSLSKAATKYGKRVGCHLKIDTGMARLGITKKEALALVEKAAVCAGCGLRGCSRILPIHPLHGRSRQLSRYQSSTPLFVILKMPGFLPALNTWQTARRFKGFLNRLAIWFAPELCSMARHLKKPDSLRL